jgi:hypothetical protein
MAVRRLATGLAVLCTAAAGAAPASAADWRAQANAICSDYYDAAAVAAGEVETSEAALPAYLTTLARLTERKDAGLARLRPPARHAAAVKRLLAHDRRAATTLRTAATLLRHGHSINRLADRYGRDTRAVRSIAHALGLGACAGQGVVTGPAEDL